MIKRKQTMFIDIGMEAFNGNIRYTLVLDFMLTVIIRIEEIPMMHLVLVEISESFGILFRFLIHGIIVELM